MQYGNSKKKIEEEKDFNFLDIKKIKTSQNNLLID